VFIAGSSVKSGTFAINGKTGTHDIASGTKTINKTTSEQTITFSVSFGFNLTWSGSYKGTATADGSINVAKKSSYTIAYNANGGTGAPSSQTKWHGTNITISSTKPTRTGYSFQGWALTKADADNGSWYYGAGYTCGKNEILTLYAVWKANTYTIKFNANGGTGAPSNQTKTYGVNLKLPSTKPTRANYNFLGWSTSSTATTATYSAGGNYTANSAATLYAVWQLAYVKPRITNYTVVRCRSDETVDEEGTYGLVNFNWACDKTVSKVLIEWYLGTSRLGSTTVAASGTSGTVSQRIGNNDLSSESTYTITVTVTDAVDNNEASKTLYSVKFLIDAIAQNKGIAFGKTAELENVMDVAFRIRPLGGYIHPVIAAGSDFNTLRTPGIYAGENVSSNPYLNCPISAGTFTLEVLSAGPNGQILQRLTRCDKNYPLVYERFYYTNAWGDWNGGWIYPTLGSSFAMYGESVSDNQTRYRKDGRMVELRGVVTPVSDIDGGNTSYTICTLPAAYRPNSPIYVTCQGSGVCVWLLQITTGGAVTFSRYRNGDAYANAAAGTWLPFQVTYFTN
jgi:uncharacterized repeat protein (TIGR02543 family)